MKLSVCIITKNEKDKLERCISELKKYPFELVVVDTGSSDGTPELIKDKADIGGDFTWCDDFSKARNYCISLATNDWILTIDSDEYVKDIDIEAIDSFIEGNPMHVGRIERINAIATENGEDSPSLSTERIARLFNRQYFTYRGRIHEQVVPIANNSVNEEGYIEDIQYRDVTISVDHDGYVGSEEDMLNKAKRNIDLLLLDLEEFGDDAYTLFQLGKSYFVLKDYEDAFGYFERALNLPLNPQYEYVQDLIETYGYTLLELGRYEDMLMLENVYDDLGHLADYIFVMGLAYMNNGMFDLAIEQFLKATTIDNAKVSGVNSFKAYYNAGVITECLGRKDEAIDYYLRCGDYQPAQSRLEELRRDIVFLPYKASMWDSLEGAYKKAIEDNKYNVYVVPIPYYDRNADGSLGQMHWEIDEFPKDVKVTSYETYDITKRHPAEVYIHNPYDEGNFVTTVHPFFYSKNIKQYTDKLIYIPYFVFDNSVVPSKAAAQSAAHLTQVSAVVNADEVIVQSENVKKLYVEGMVLLGGEGVREHFEKKIIAGGSSKIDKVINSSIDDYDIPEEWNSIIYDANGNRRKVVLYNTSVTAFLENSEGMLDKIERALEVFKNSADKIALLWRPHPLMVATIKSLRPELLDRYQGILDNYKASGWGILDESADLDRAIILADAYFGDPSSLVTLCKAKKMPIMIQNVFV